MTAPARLSLPDHVVSAWVDMALTEDLGDAGDVTTHFTVPADRIVSAGISARAPGIIAGLPFVKEAFAQIDPAVEVTLLQQDGAKLSEGGQIARLHGPARSILTAERVALNFLGQLSGVATRTGQFVDAIKGTKARITCTRKTVPGLRAAQKYAVRCGGGVNHRFGLYDGILIKDNHIAAAGGVTAALRAAKAGAGHMLRIEIEVDTLVQLEEAMAEGPDAVLLDNMTPDTLRQAVKIIGGRAVAEASGGVTLGAVRAVAETGVDLISVGGLTHSAPSLDVGLDV